VYGVELGAFPFACVLNNELDVGVCAKEKSIAVGFTPLG